MALRMSFSISYISRFGLCTKVVLSLISFQDLEFFVYIGGGIYIQRLLKNFKEIQESYKEVYKQCFLIKGLYKLSIYSSDFPPYSYELGLGRQNSYIN